MSKPSHSVPLKPSVRRERQIPSDMKHDAPTKTHKTASLESNSKKSRSVSSPPQSDKVLKSSHPISVQPNIRRERQIPALNEYDTPDKTYTSTTLEAVPATVDARRIPTPKQSYKNTRARDPIAITRYIYNSPTGEEKEGDDVFNYAYETENGIKQR